MTRFQNRKSKVMENHPKKKSDKILLLGIFGLTIIFGIAQALISPYTNKKVAEASLIPFSTENAVAVANLPSSEVLGVGLGVESITKTARITCYRDFGKMANGKITYPLAVAASDRSIPLNTKIYIEGYGELTITDRTAKWVHEKYGTTFDLYMPDCDMNFGVKKLTYKLL